MNVNDLMRQGYEVATLLGENAVLEDAADGPCRVFGVSYFSDDGHYCRVWNAATATGDQYFMIYSSFLPWAISKMFGQAGILFEHGLTLQALDGGVPGSRSRLCAWWLRP